VNFPARDSSYQTCLSGHLGVEAPKSLTSPFPAGRDKVRGNLMTKKKEEKNEAVDMIKIWCAVLVVCGWEQAGPPPIIKLGAHAPQTGALATWDGTDQRGRVGAEDLKEV